MLVHIKYVNEVREGNVNGSLRLADGSYVSVPPNLLPLFRGLENSQVEIATKEFTGRDGKMRLTAASGPVGTAAPVQRPPVNSPTLQPPRPGQGGPVGVSPQAAPRNAETDRHIFVTGIVGRAMGSGKFTASEIRVLTQEALAAFEMLSKPLPPAKPVPIVTGTDNTWTSEPPKDEPGDPGAQLQ